MPKSTPLSLTHHKLILCKLFYNFYIIVHKNRFSLTFTLKRFTIEKM